jgi:hypothetical protein
MKHTIAICEWRIEGDRERVSINISCMRDMGSLDLCFRRVVTHADSWCESRRGLAYTALDGKWCVVEHLAQRYADPLRVEQRECLELALAMSSGIIEKYGDLRSPKAVENE